MKVPRAPELGCGIYLIADVSRYTGIPYSTVASWFHSDALLNTDYDRIGDSLSVSFYDLIDALVAYQFRKLGVKMRIVRRAYELLKTQLNTEHAFCHRDLHSDGRSIIARSLETFGLLQDAISRQTLFSYVEQALDKVSYSDMTKLAQRWRIHDGLIVDPHVAMGAPVIEGTGVTSFVVSNAYYANGEDEEFVARLFEISPDQVRMAVQFETQIRSAA